MIKNLDMESFLGQVEIFIKETMRMILEMVMDKCIGLTEVFIRVSGKMEFNMD